MNACTNQGVWKSLERVRGPGGWLNDRGGLIFHCGDKLWTLDEKGNVLLQDPGRLSDGYVYTSDAPILRPADEPVAGEGGPAEELWDIFKTWSVERRALDPMLLLGFVLCCMVGGALPWRPMIFVTGDQETGKSTLQKILRHVHGPEGVISTANATEAAISQRLGMSCLPVSVDEIESEVDNQRAQDVLRLARLASSGDLRLRGTSNHEAHSSRALSCFMFSAIIPPPLPPQDRRRMAIIRLGPLSRGTQSPEIVPAFFHDLGAKLKRRLADHWHRFERTDRLFRGMLMAAGHSRGALDQYSTLMSAAHIGLFDEDPSDDMLKTWEKQFAVAEFRETSDTRSNALGCLDELVQSQPDVFKGGTRKSVGRLVRDIVTFYERTPQLARADGGSDGDELRGLKDSLAAAGLAIVKAKDGVVYLAVPHAHKQVAHIYRDSTWRAVAGASGGWVEALSRLPGVLIGRPTRIDGGVTKCLHVPVSLVIPDEAEGKTG
jgi:hypothetical protein